MYVSPLRRTAETAAPLAASLGLEPLVDSDLREVHLGAWEGGLFRKHGRRAPSAGPPPVARGALGRDPRGRARGRVLRARRRAAIERIVAAHPGQRVAVFSHGGVIGHALAQASDSRPFVFIHADNASISQLVVTPRRWLVRRFNDTAHLEAARLTTDTRRT